MKYLYCYFLFVYFSVTTLALIHAQNNEEHLAEAFFAARDYSRATNSYQILLKQPLPEWQKQRVLYNLGTVQLAAQRTEDAIQLFQSMHPDAIAYPLLLQYYMTNKGLAFLQQAMHIKQPEAKAIALSNSLKILAEAKRLTCERLIHEENEPNCLYPASVTGGIEIAYQQQSEIEKEERVQLFSSQHPLFYFAILQHMLEQFQFMIHSLSDSNIPSGMKEQYMHFIHLQKAELDGQWNESWHQSTSDKQKKSIKNAFEYYLKAFQMLDNQQWKQAVDYLNSSKDTLADFNGIQLFNYRLLIDYIDLLNQQWIQENQLQNIQERINKLQPSNDQKKIVHHAQSYLKLAIKYLKSESSNLTLFFLWASFYKLQRYIENNPSDTSAVNVLQQALKTAKSGLKLNRLSQNDLHANPSLISIIKEFQMLTIQDANTFIESVLSQQKTDFEKKGEKSPTQCQQYPWKIVIPLFEKGYLSAKHAMDLLSNSSDSSIIIFDQLQTISYWKQALEAMNKPLTPEEPSQNPDAEKTQDLFRSLQEMEIEDRPNKEPSNKELESW